MRKTHFSFAALMVVMLLASRGASQETAPSGSRAEAQQEPAVSPTIRVAGVVRTGKGVPVPLAGVRAVHLSSGLAWATLTSETGEFVFPDLPAGRYRFEARQLGLGTASQEAEFSDNAEGIGLTLRNSLPAVKPETAVESPSGVAPAKPVSEAGAESSGREPGKRADVNGEVRTSNQADETESSTANVKRARPSGRKTAESGRSDVNKSSTGAKRQPGFEQVEAKGQPTASSELGQEMSSPAGTSALGQKASPDAFLISGTVGHGVISGQGGEESDSTEQPDSNKARKEKHQRGSHKRGAKPQFGQANSAEGIDAAITQGKMANLAANGVRFSFYNRYGNSLADAKEYALQGTQPAKIHYSRENFHVRLGGPLLIPHVYNGRDRTFFFVGYDLARNTVPLDQFITVPLPEERHGDFTARGVQLFDPLSNLAGPRSLLGSVIPASRLDPAALALMQFFPLPNLPGTVQNFHLQSTMPQSGDRVNVRILHTISPQLSLQANYNLNSQRGEIDHLLPSLGNYLAIREQNVTLNLIQNWTPRLLHETGINWTRSRSLVAGQFTLAKDVAGELGITGVSRDPFFFGVPIVKFANFEHIDDMIPQYRVNQTLRVMDSLSYSLPKHTLRVGAEIRRMQINFLLAPLPRGQFLFNGLMTSQLDASGNPLPGTGFDLADMLLGLPAQTSVATASQMDYFRGLWLIGYFQDDWRLHPRFSVNLGVRYELRSPSVEKYDRISNLDLNSDITAAARVLPGQTGMFSGPLPRALLRSEHNNWAPRIGIAWRPLPRQSLVVRAGYGMFYNAAIYNEFGLTLAQQPPFAQTQDRQTSADTLLTLRNGFPPAPVGAVLNTDAVDPNFKIPYAQIWNLSVETPIRSDLSVEVTYTGTKGTNLHLIRSPNRPLPGTDPLHIENSRRIPGYGSFLYDTSSASSIYHALQVRVERRMAHGLKLMGLYTFGKSIDNASSVGGGNTTVVQDDRNFAGERGLSSFDIHHQFTMLYSYELPFGERKRWLRSGWLGGALGNWLISGDMTMATGTPFTAFVGGAAASSAGTGANFSLRPDAVGNSTLSSGQQTPFHFFNTDAFVLPPADRYGTAGRNTIIGPGRFNINLQLKRRWHLGKNERYHLTLSWDVVNLLNHPNFTGVETIFGESAFGHVSGVAPMRTIDIAIRGSF